MRNFWPENQIPTELKCDTFVQSLIHSGTFYPPKCGPKCKIICAKIYVSYENQRQQGKPNFMYRIWINHFFLTTFRGLCRSLQISLLLIFDELTWTVSNWGASSSASGTAFRIDFLGLISLQKQLPELINVEQSPQNSSDLYCMVVISMLGSCFMSGGGDSPAL